MATKKRFAAMASKRFSRRIRNRENINIEKDADKSIDIRKSADQFQQNEFLKLFQLERTSSPTDQSSQGQQTIATKMDSDINSSVSNIVFRGFSSSPVVASKRSRGGKLKSFDPRKFDDMSTHLSEQITSTGSFVEKLYMLAVRENHILQKKNQILQRENIKMLQKEEYRYRQNLLDHYKNINEGLKQSLQVLQQQLQILLS